VLQPRTAAPAILLDARGFRDATPPPWIEAVVILFLDLGSSCVNLRIDCPLQVLLSTRSSPLLASILVDPATCNPGFMRMHLDLNRQHRPSAGPLTLDLTVQYLPTAPRSYAWIIALYSCLFGKT